MFVAIEPPLHVREDLAPFLEPRSEHPWIHPDQWHVTLAFLPGVPEHRTDELIDALGDLASRRPAMDLRLQGAGAFPDPWRAAVLWMDVRGDVDELGRLAVNVRHAAQHLGATPGGRSFRAHLSVSRLRRVQEQTRWVRILDGYAGPRWCADSVSLIASYLHEGPGGRPRYETVARVRLADSKRQP